MNQSVYEVSRSTRLIMLLCGIIGLLACVVIVLGDVIGSIVVINYSPISETISDLAAGDKSWIIDTALQCLGAGIIVCAIGLYRWELDELTWKISSVFLSLVGLDIFIIAQRNVYGDREPWGTEIHIYLVLALGILFGLATWFYGKGFKQLSPFWFRFTRVISVAWFILAPLFFLIPDRWNGAYERGLAVIMLTWLGAISWLLTKPQRIKQA